MFDVGVRAAVRRRARAPRPLALSAAEPRPAEPGAAEPGAAEQGAGAAPAARSPRALRRADRSRAFWSDLSSSEDDTAQVLELDRLVLNILILLYVDRTCAFEVEPVWPDTFKLMYGILVLS